MIHLNQVLDKTFAVNRDEVGNVSPEVDLFMKPEPDYDNYMQEHN